MPPRRKSAGGQEFHTGQAAHNRAQQRRPSRRRAPSPRPPATALQPLSELTPGSDRRFRWLASSTITPSPQGLIVGTTAGSFLLDGADGTVIGRFVRLLDGTRTIEELAEALPGYSRTSIEAVLETLIESRAVEATTELQSQWGEPTAAAPRDLSQARLLLVGLEPWGLVAGAALAAGGVGHLHVIDERPVSDRDARGLAGWGTQLVGVPRSQVLADEVARSSPRSRVVTSALSLAASGELELPQESFDLAVVATAAEEFSVLQAVARAAHRRRLRSMSASMQGTEAVVGPGVAPGSTACWNCYHHRRLAAMEDPWAADRLDRAARYGQPSGPPFTYLAPAVGLLGSLVALEALQMLNFAAPCRLLGGVLIQDVVTLETSRHRLVQLPWCEVCGGAADNPASSEPRTTHSDERSGEQSPLEARPPPQDGDPDARLPDTGSPADVRRQLSDWVDSHCGIIRSVAADHPPAEDPALPRTATAVLSWWGDLSRGVDSAGGKGPTVAAAMIGAVAEGLERYSASRVRPQDLRFARLDELPPDERLDPRDLGLYDDEQYERPGFPHARFDAGRPLWWAQGWWVPSWRPAWLPALATHIDVPVAPEDDFVQVTSNGLGAGVSPAAAARAAAFELIERDALVTTWLTRRPGRELLIDAALGEDALEIVRQLQTCGAVVRLVALSAGVRAPVVACLAFGDGDAWPAVTLASSSGPDLVSAARRAVFEQGHAGPAVRRAIRGGALVPSRPDAVRTPLDHALLFTPAGHAEAVDFLFGSPDPPAAIAELENEPILTVEDCGRRLAEAGVHLAVADVTSPDLRLGPWNVVRALGTGAQSIHFGWGMERRANPRLARLLNGPLNLLPHPLA
jgi:ribosomal protein S12 methylthiotransferase accessory factor